MKRTTIESIYFYGEKCSDYAIKNGYVDYRTLANCGDMVLCNDVTKLFYNSIGQEYLEPNQVNGYIDNSEQIEELQEQIEELEEKQVELIKEDLEESQEYKELQELIEELEEKIKDLEYEQEHQQEIYQYYIIDNNLAQILQEWTNEIIYYIDYLDIYVWGITHYGTSWDYVLTDIKIDLGLTKNE